MWSDHFNLGFTWESLGNILSFFCQFAAGQLGEFTLLRDKEVRILREPWSSDAWFMKFAAILVEQGFKEVVYCHTVWPLMPDSWNFSYFSNPVALSNNFSVQTLPSGNREARLFSDESDFWADMICYDISKFRAVRRFFFP